VGGGRWDGDGETGQIKINIAQSLNHYDTIYGVVYHIWYYIKTICKYYIPMLFIVCIICIVGTTAFDPFFKYTSFNRERMTFKPKIISPTETDDVPVIDERGADSRHKQTVLETEEMALMNNIFRNHEIHTKLEYFKALKKGVFFHHPNSHFMKNKKWFHESNDIKNGGLFDEWMFGGEE
jgi:hypothetical protein